MLRTPLLLLPILLLVLLALAASPAQAKEGVDIADLYSTSDFECMLDTGRSFAVVRAYRSLGEVDTNAPQNVFNAIDAGMDEVDGYIFPCPKCGSSGAAQVEETVAYLTMNGVTVAREGDAAAGKAGNASKASPYVMQMLFLDIEDTASYSYWSTSTSSNIDFIRSMLDGCDATGVSCGIYTSSSMWEQITADTTEFSDVPLWDAHWNDAHTLDDFKPYAGWTSCIMKQYAGDTVLCGLDVDLDYA